MVLDLLRKEVFDPEVDILFQKMVPVYKKHFTHEQVKMVPVSQAWGMGLGQKINDYLTKKGF